MPWWEVPAGIGLAAVANLFGLATFAILFFAGSGDFMFPLVVYLPGLVATVLFAVAAFLASRTGRRALVASTVIAFFVLGVASLAVAYAAIWTFG